MVRLQWARGMVALTVKDTKGGAKRPLVSFTVYLLVPAALPAKVDMRVPPGFGRDHVARIKRIYMYIYIHVYILYLYIYIHIHIYIYYIYIYMCV